jgi:hypothetical protein
MILNNFMFNYFEKKKFKKISKKLYLIKMNVLGLNLYINDTGIMAILIRV